MTLPLRAALATMLATATALGTTTASAPARADSPAVTVDLHCTYPLIGPRALSVAISTSLPATIEAGTSTGPIQVDAVATISADTTPGMVLVGAKSMEGTALASAHISGPGLDLDLAVPTVLESTPVPASGAFDTIAHATIAPITFPQAGTYQVTVDDLLLSITPRDGAGRTTGLDSFDSDCALDAGEEPVVATVEVTGDGGPTDPPPVRRKHTVTGSSYLATPKVTTPLRGALDATYAGTGTVTGDATFEPTTATIRMFAFFPATARIQLVPVSRTTGSLTSGVLSTRTDVDVRVPSVTFFGFPIAGGKDCHTTAPVTLPLRSGAGFDPTAGGRLTGRYLLPAFTRCGSMTDALSQALSGPDNTLTTTLSPGT